MNTQQKQMLEAALAILETLEFHIRKEKRSKKAKVWAERVHEVVGLVYHALKPEAQLEIK